MVGIPQTAPSKSTPWLRCETCSHPVAFLFTDLRNSTALYERMGDAAAYEVVRQHFALLTHIILNRNGTVVKTIGDAMMAAFDDPFAAVEAALSAQAAHADGNRHRHVAVRLGVHVGECVRIGTGSRVDYFGSTVNLAAKLRAKSRNGDVVLSHAIAGYPAIGRLLETLPTREESLAFRGFDEPVRLVRVLPRAGRSSATVQPWLSGWAGAQVRPETCHELDGR